MQKPQELRVRLDALEIFTAVLSFVLGSFFVLTFAQNAQTPQTEVALADRILLLLVAAIALCFLAGGITTLLKARRVAGAVYAFAALGLLGLGISTGLSLLAGRSSFSAIPWTGIMLVTALIGLAGLYAWFARRALRLL
jgi:hypothetical protein